MVCRGHRLLGGVRGRIGLAHSVAMRLSQLSPQSDSLFEVKTVGVMLMRPSVCDDERQQQPRQQRATSAGLARKAAARLTR